MKRLFAWSVRFALPPLALFVIVLAVWHAATILFSIEQYLLPTPGQVFHSALEHKDALLHAAMLTGLAAVAGFLASTCVGMLMACLFSQSRLIQRSIYPYAIFLQTVPIVGIAPLIVVWFGYGFRSVVVVAFIISLFPMITNTTTGLTTIDKNLLELFSLANASRWQILVKLRLPNSIPYVVTGAKISSGLSVVGAIVGEIFAGAGMDSVGLGSLIEQSRGQLLTDYLFAAVLTSTVLGIVVFAAVSWIGTAITWFWQGEQAMD